MNSHVILLDGDIVVTERLKALCRGRPVIAADGGIRHAGPLGLTPQVWLGDFDSAPDDPATTAGIPVIPYPPEKDVTDGEIAIDYARERGADHLILVGAFGGRRADHALLHKTMAVSLAAQEVAVELHDGTQEGRPLLPGVHNFGFETGTLFSIIGLSDLEGLSVASAKWPLEEIDVPLGSSLTISNIAAEGLMIRLRAGRAILIAQMEG